MIQYVESLAQPEAELQAPIQAVEQPVFPEAGPSQRRAPRSKRYSHVQIKALETFIAVHPTPTYEQKFSAQSTNWIDHKEDQQLESLLKKFLASSVRARDEFIFMATAGYPLWVSSDRQRLSSRNSQLRRHGHQRPDPGGLIPRRRRKLQGEEASHVSGACINNSPTFLAREAQFVRYSHQQLDGSWIVVDVSVDELRQFHRPSTRSVCRKRPSGCLIRDMQNGSSLVTWVENVDVREKEDEMHAILKPFVESSFAFNSSTTGRALYLLHGYQHHPVTHPFHQKEEEALQ
ncbi:hypothetical protein M0R45_031068 [Rubus argutus]|uniref:START domain-containing protein n=1 Tax=Rubus argutus TaxID=59490 RepID=A0AAW1WFD6_RUBAR